MAEDQHGQMSLDMAYGAVTLGSGVLFILLSAEMLCACLGAACRGIPFLPLPLLLVPLVMCPNWARH